MTPREKELIEALKDLANHVLQYRAKELDSNTLRTDLHKARVWIKAKAELALDVANWETRKG